MFKLIIEIVVRDTIAIIMTFSSITDQDITNPILITTTIIILVVITAGTVIVAAIIMWAVVFNV